MTLCEGRPSVEDVAQLRLKVALIIFFYYSLYRHVNFHSISCSFIDGDLCLISKFASCTLVSFSIELSLLYSISYCELSIDYFSFGLCYFRLGYPVLKSCLHLVEHRLFHMLDLSLQNAFKVFLIANNFNPLLNSPLSLDIVISLECICENTLSLKHQI